VPLTELFGLYDRIPDREIRDGLIFAYSQRGERAAIDKLVEIAKTEKDRELRKKALFWLGQSHDPRVAQILEDILNKP
jgi:HEAT repeat protein